MLGKKKEKDPEPLTEIGLKEVLEAFQTDTATELNLNPSNNIELTHEIVDKMFDSDKLDMITDVSDKEIQGLLRLSVVNKIFFDGKTSVLTSFMDNFKRLKISRNRQSRKELVKAIFSTSNTQDDNDNTSRFNRFLG